jgi:ceramide glucosyltransferase
MLILIIKTAAVLGALSSLGYYAVSLWASRWFFQKSRSAKPGHFTPSVSILKPLCGADPNAYESLRSHCTQDYPDYEIVFGVNDPEDAAIPIVERLIREFPERRIQLVVCRKVLGSNYKISNLIQMSPLATHEYLLVNDSDIAVHPRYLRDVMNEFEHSRTGMTTCLYRGVAGQTLGARLEALGISTDFIPGVLTARQVEGGIHFALGSTLAFRREALNAAGGFESVVDYLGDDYELGKRIADAGWTIAIAPCVVEHYLPDYSFRDYIRHQLRWNRNIRDSRPKGFIGLVLTFGLPWAILAVVAAPHSPWVWGLFGVTLAARFALAFVVGTGVLHDRRLLSDFWLVPIRDLIAVALWAGSLTGRTIVWRGNQFALENGKLRPL